MGCPVPHIISERGDDRAHQAAAAAAIKVRVRKQKQEGKRAMSYPSNQSADVDLSPDMFLYGRKGPWPQPSPSHPLKQAAEVLSVPLVESLVWDATVGLRLVKDGAGYPGFAAQLAAQDLTQPIPSDDQFNSYMLNSAYARYKKPISKPVSDEDRVYLAKIPSEIADGITFKYDFSAMKLVQPMDGLYCAPTVCLFGHKREDIAGFGCAAIIFRGDTHEQDVVVYPSSPEAEWNVAKIYALQGAAYHMLFVVHPALHMPLDAVNAITKTAVPQNHPLFQLLYPHTSYTLALDNSVLEGANSVVNDNAQGTWFDPLMGNAYNLKLLFAAGYTGLKDLKGKDNWFGNSYPPYNYMTPQMGNPGDMDYLGFLAAYFDSSFVFGTAFTCLPFCAAVAEEILKDHPDDTYVTRWARYNATYVQGFPSEKEILKKDVLAKAMAIYLWDTTVSHGADHYSFAVNIPARYKFLRVRNYPPLTVQKPPKDGGPKTVGDIANGDDLFRMEMAHMLFFMPHAMKPNLWETLHPFTNSTLAQKDLQFHGGLELCSKQYTYSANTPYMPLTEDQVPPDIGPSFKVLGRTVTYPFEAYSCTIPASIQY